MLGRLRTVQRIDPEIAVGGLTAAAAATGFGLRAYAGIGKEPPGDVVMCSLLYGFFGGTAGATIGSFATVLPKTVTASVIAVGATYTVAYKAYTEKMVRLQRATGSK
jgi:hypothetical protein